MFKSILATLAVSVAAFAHPSLSPRVSACGNDLPAGLPEECYNNDIGCQYGIINQGTTIHDRGVINPDGSVQPFGSYVVSIGSRSTSRGSLLILNPTSALIGGTLINLGGSANNFTEYLQLSGEGFVDGQNYIASLGTYNTTTGNLLGGGGNLYFAWKA